MIKMSAIPCIKFSPRVQYVVTVTTEIPTHLTYTVILKDQELCFSS